jgi:hypothetical protein
MSAWFFWAVVLAEPCGPVGARIPTVIVGVGATCAALTARERERYPVLGSLVNAFTNCGDVKGELRQ